MTALESIGIARTRIAEARELLVRPSPTSLETCRALLDEVATILEELVALGAGGLTPELIGVVRQIQQGARELQERIQHGSRFCLGFLQMRMGVGYTENGVPVMLESSMETHGRFFEL